MKTIANFSLLIVILISMQSFVSASSSFAAQGAESKLSDNKLRSLMSASSPTEVHSVIDAHESVVNARIECDVQLSGKRIPAACFKVLAKEKRVGLNKKRSMDFAWLESLCLSRAKKTNDREELRKQKREEALPPKCREVVSERLLDLEYADEASKPASLFDDRLSADTVN